MYKNRRIKKNTNIKLMITSVLIIAAVAVISYFGVQHLVDNKNNEPLSSQNTINYDPPTDEQIKSSEETKDDLIKQAIDQQEGVVKPDFEQVITAAEANEGTVYVRNEISKLSNDGKCLLALTRGGRTINKEAGLQALAKVSTCRGFNIPISELGAGVWQIRLEVQIGEVTKIATAEVTI